MPFPHTSLLLSLLLSVKGEGRRQTGRGKVRIGGGARGEGARMLLCAMLPFQRLFNQLVLDFVVVLVELPDDVLDDECIGIFDFCDRILAQLVKMDKQLVVAAHDLVEFSRKCGEGHDLCCAMPTGKDGGHCSY